MTGSYRFGNKTYGYDVISAQFTFFNRGTWGDPQSATTESTTIKDVDVVVGAHSHAINVHVPVIKELWLEFSVAPVFGLGLEHRHFFKAGLFPFRLGRGIALGDAYSTVPDLIGFNPLSGINQFAPGFLLTGDIVEDVLAYDIYAAILNNKADTFDNQNMKTQGQQYGRRYNQARGACQPKINYLVAGRLFFTPFEEPLKKLTVEPYALFNDDREQKIEFLGDAQTRLTTFGFAIQAEHGNWEGGMDCAFNRGKQTVYGWDRNAIIKQLRNGIPFVVNSKVNATTDAQPNISDLANKNAVFVPNSSAQIAIENSIQDEAFNGQVFFNGLLKNAADRFSNPYQNILGGSMMVFDIAYWLHRPDARVAFTGGFASGDQNPNRDLDELGDSNIDGTYDGFIGLQEAYSGQLVRSAFLLGGQGRVPRVLSFPVQGVSDGLPSNVNRFTNLIFTGAALWTEPKFCNKKWKINPNVLWYWSDEPTRAFDRSSGTPREFFADNFYGYELNIFIETMLMTDLKFFTVASMFVPGGFFQDIKGRPINKEQQKYLDQFDRTGVNSNLDRVPLHGTDKALVLNLGLEYKF